MSRGTGANDPRAELAERLRDLLAGEPTVREVAMFGTRTFMVDDRIVAGARKDGGLLVRVPAERAGELGARPGAAPAEMGEGRRMGAGWLTVAASAIENDTALAEWLAAALGSGRSS